MRTHEFAFVNHLSKEKSGQVPNVNAGNFFVSQSLGFLEPRGSR